LEQDLTKVGELTQEDFEALKSLAGSPFWAVYKKHLMKAEVEIRRGASLGRGFDGMIDSWQKSGVATGINFAITQLQALLAVYDKKQQVLLAKEAKKPEPFRKG
jgi:hypothetical protein